MARSRPPETKSANLTIEQMRAAIPKLERRIKDLETFDVGSIRERFDPVAKALAKKVDGTLQEILGHDTVEYYQYSVHSLDTLPVIMGGGPYPLPRVHEGYRKGIEGCVLKLKTLKELFEERIADALPVEEPPSPTQTKPRFGTRRVFVVHGHDDGTKETVARYLTKLGLEAVILHEQPNQGRTVIEKFEDHAVVDFAVALFTPDDIGYPASSPEKARPRARQNVVLELGFFMAMLGRQRVCVLYRGDVEVPSDYAGVLYIELDNAGAWKFLLAQEMKGVGIDIDLNSVA
jgi:predicted nucleotide-binding protein